MADTEFAKTHLRDHLTSLIIPPVSEGFWSIASSAKELCDRNGTPDQLLRTIQNLFTKIPEWTETTLTTEVERIQKVSRCGYLDDLLMGVFVAYMKSFASLHYRGPSTELHIDFERPTLDKFIHELYKQSARKLWQVAYLFKTVGVSSEQQARNRQDVEKVVTVCLEQVISGFLPWETIAKKYFTQDETVHKVTVTEDAHKAVSFGENEYDSASSDSEEEEEEEQPKLQLSEETATLDIEDLDKPKEEEDPLKELEKKMEDTLVLNL